LLAGIQGTDLATRDVVTRADAECQKHTGNGCDCLQAIDATVPDVSYDASRRDKRELLSDWVAIMRQLRELGVIRTNNNPIGDIAEALVCDHYGGERASFSQKGWDVKTPAGERIQVKSRRKTPDSTPTVLSPISDDEYDSLVVILFNEDFQVTEGLKATRALVEARFNLDSKNQRRVRLSKLRADPEVEEVDFSAVSAWLSPVVVD